jgi:hypothetical protein
MGRGFDSSTQSQIRPAMNITEREQAEKRKRHRKAILCVAGRAAGPDEFLDLLDMLGLDPTEGKTTP